MSGKKVETPINDHQDQPEDSQSALFLTRVPDDELSWIDYLIKDAGFYASRPDFIMDAWRSAYLGLEKRIIDFWSLLRTRSEDPRIRVNLLEATIKKSYEEWIYPIKRTHSVQVTLKIPVALRTRLEEVDTIGLNLGLQTFCRTSTTVYLNEMKRLMGVPPGMSVEDFKKSSPDGFRHRSSVIKEILDAHASAERLDNDIVDEILNENDTH